MEILLRHQSAAFQDAELPRHIAEVDSAMVKYCCDDLSVNGGGIVLQEEPDIEIELCRGVKRSVSTMQPSSRF